jgi:hypothetical protein
MTREDKNLVKKLKNIIANQTTQFKYRKVNNLEFYWAMSETGKPLFYIKRTCDVSSGHPVFSYVIKYQGKKTTNKAIGDGIFPLMEFGYHKNWLKAKGKIIAQQKAK